MRRDVEFASEGITCRAWLYTPDRSSGGRHPAIVMAHGFSAVKEMRLDRFAAAFAEAGIASLVFDYRGLGSSDGEPRQDIDPRAQIADYRNAISFARTLNEIDGERIGVWGTSYSGAHVLVVAAFDRRVRAVVSTVPLIDGWRTFGQLMGEEARSDLVAQLIAERERIYAGEPAALIPVVTDKEEMAALATSDSWEWFQLAARTAPTWRNEVTLRSMERLLEYAPLHVIDRIAPTPLLMIAAETDFLPLALAEEAFARAAEPKRLRILPGGHFAPYEPPHFDSAAGWACEWFAEHLGRVR
jgi:fermentation-respiration switch protein FrsA (DUF1100 family)